MNPTEKDWKKMALSLESILRDIVLSFYTSCPTQRGCTRLDEAKDVLADFQKLKEGKP